MADDCSPNRRASWSFNPEGGFIRWNQSVLSECSNIRMLLDEEGNIINDECQYKALVQNLIPDFGKVSESDDSSADLHLPAASALSCSEDSEDSAAYSPRPPQKITSTTREVKQITTTKSRNDNFSAFKGVSMESRVGFKSNSSQRHVSCVHNHPCNTCKVHCKTHQSPQLRRLSMLMAAACTTEKENIANNTPLHSSQHINRNISTVGDQTDTSLSKKSTRPRKQKKYYSRPRTRFWYPPRGQPPIKVSVTDVTCNSLRIRFVESPTDQGFFYSSMDA